MNRADKADACVCACFCTCTSTEREKDFNRLQIISTQTSRSQLKAHFLSRALDPNSLCVGLWMYLSVPKV